MLANKTRIAVNLGDFPGGPVVKNLSSNAGDMGLTPSRGTKIPHTMGQQSLHAATREKRMCHNKDPAQPHTHTHKIEIMPVCITCGTKYFQVTKIKCNQYNVLYITL